MRWLVAIAASAALSNGGAPTVTQVRATTNVVHHENSVFEEEEIQTVISAVVLPATGRLPLSLDRIHVYLHGLTIEGGKRSYDARTGSFQLVLSMQESLRLAGQAIRSGHLPVGNLARITAQDERGASGEGTFDPRAEGTAFEGRLSAGVTDRFGRFINQGGDEAPVYPPRAAGRIYNLVGPAPAKRGHLELKIERRFPVSLPTGFPRGASAGLTPAFGSQVDFTLADGIRSSLVSLDAKTGQVAATRELVAAPKGHVLFARRSEGRLDWLAIRRDGDEVVEALASRERAWLGGSRTSFGPDNGALDFLADARRIVMVERDWGLTFEAHDWHGHASWQVDNVALLPGTNCEDFHGDAAMTALSDGSILVSQNGSDEAQPDHPRFVALSRLSGDRGKVLGSRLVYPPLEPDDSIDGVVGVRFAGHDLVVFQLSRAGGTETQVIDMAEDAWRPLVRVLIPEEGALSVDGAAVAGERLVIGCGYGGIATLTAKKGSR